MLTTIQGTYEDGKITLDEIPSVKSKSKIVVTFLEEILDNAPKKRKLGSLKGKIGIPDDFNDPIDDLNEYMYE
ncbi:DUF2281 domain-containing protein [Dyadobacter bucti]|jgi:hypothetical protein|uniref:DUF2281 domain-containing protein n=1 Tax=Dyadobacter bucti TaxID=2572203 RepID=UPI00110988C6|nr:DUF2281 domain-containing protein [Dyadobacter bucti]